MLSKEMEQCVDAFVLQLRNKDSRRAYLHELRQFSELIGRSPEHMVSSDAVAYAMYLRRQGYKERTCVKKIQMLKAVTRFMEKNRDTYGFKNFRNFFLDLHVEEPWSEKFDASLTVSLKDLDVLIGSPRIQKDPQLYGAILLAFKCMLTVSEILSLKVSDFSISEDGRLALSVKSPRANGGRSIFVPEDCKANIHRLVAGAMENPDGILFYSRRTKRATGRCVLTRKLQIICSKLPLEGEVTFNALRNTGICHCSIGDDQDLALSLGQTGKWHLKRLESRRNLVCFDAPDYVNIHLRKAR